MNDELKNEGKKPATGERVLMGITKASAVKQSHLSQQLLSKKLQEF